eukprot:3574199-Pyramimonas_sp.AAC.1
MRAPANTRRSRACEADVVGRRVDGFNLAPRQQLQSEINLDLADLPRPAKDDPQRRSFLGPGGAAAG